MVVRIAVIGAGIVGLSSAIAIKDRLPQAEVEILADKFTRHTTSDGAGGIFMPCAEGVSPALEERWARDGAHHYFSLAQSEESSSSGVFLLSGIELANNPEVPKWAKYMIGFRKMPAEFMKDSIKHYKTGWWFTTAIIEGPKYLPWLTKKFLARGGRVTKRTVNSLDELCDEYDLVVNCTGLAAGKLLGDPKIQPLRGHIIRVKAPWIKHFYHTDDHRYILPASETAAVGGFKQIGRDELAPDAAESEKIWQGARERFPMLEGAQVLWDWVGLRPYRDSFRVETELYHCKGKQLKVVHNYGHGAFGVSMSWGTGLYAAELAEQFLGLKAKM